MRLATLGILLILALPLVGADQEQDSSIGVNLGFVAPGLWDLYRFATPGGSASLSLRWAESTYFPFADYDLRLYQPWAMDDDELQNGEIVAHSSQHPYAHHAERVDVVLPPGAFWIAVVPFQAQAERYVLDADPGDLTDQGSTFGYVEYDP